MKILYVTNDSLMYGTNKEMIYLIDALKDKIDLEFLIPDKGAIEIELKKRNIKYKISKYYSSVKALDKKDNILKRTIKIIINNIKKITLSNYYKKRNIDIIHSANSAVYMGALIAKRLNVKHIWHIRELAEEDHNFTFYNKKYIYSLFNSADKIICISNCVYNKYKNILNKDKMIMIYDGIDIKKYDIAKDTNSKNNLLFAGTLSETKGVKDAVLAVHSLVNEGITNIHLYIAGEGILKKELEDFVKNNNMEEYITFLGYVNDMKKLRRKIKIALVCSRCEALGLVTVEAMASFCIVIGTNTGATKEIIGESGLLYSYGNYLELKSKIKYALNNEKEMNNLIEKSYKNICEKFSIERCANKILSVYKELMK